MSTSPSPEGRSAMSSDNFGFGDIPSRYEDRVDPYWDTLMPNDVYPGQQDIVPADRELPEIPPEHRKFIHYLLIRQQQLFKWQLQQLNRHQQFVKNPNWIEPPPTARPTDVFTQKGVTVPVIDPADDLLTPILTFEVPDRTILVIHKIGHELSDPSQFGNVRWSIQVDEAPVPSYGNFCPQLGRFTEPTPLASPIIVRPASVVEVRAGIIAAPPAGIDCFFRWQGYTYPLNRFTDDGTFGKFETL